MAGFAAGGPVDTRGHRFSKFDSTRSVGDNLTTRPGKQKETLPKLAKGGVVRRRSSAAKLREDRRSPSPVGGMGPPPPAGRAVPAYDLPPAGTDGWPPTPNFTGDAGPNAAATPGMAKGGKWIAGAIKHPGALRKSLGVKEGEKIPAGKLAKAAQAGGKLGQRARLAQTLKGFRKAKGGECVPDKDKDRMRKGGECDKMAAGGAAKERRGFPNVIRPPARSNPVPAAREVSGRRTAGAPGDKIVGPKQWGGPKRMAKGGVVRGSGIAQRGTRFSGIY